MIVKTINSYDIQINGQLLRIVEGQELVVEARPFNSKKLLLNEPRGNKYINLITYEEKDGYLKIELDSPSVVSNKEILLKSFIKSLIDRKRIHEQDIYTVVVDEEELRYKKDNLTSLELFEVRTEDDMYCINNKLLKVVETDLLLEVNNMTAIKFAISTFEYNFDYLILINNDRFITVDKMGSVIPYPVIEVISLLSEKNEGNQFMTITGDKIEVEDNTFNYNYYLVSNSQFYIDDTDIYEEGFIIK